MTIQRNAKLAPNGRAAMIRRLEEGWSVGRVARAFHVSETTVRKWHRRYQEEGLSGLCDRSSRPGRLRCPLPQERLLQIVALRRKRLPAWQIARILGLPRSTVARVLHRLGLGRLSLLQPSQPPPRRYERSGPGELLHLDVKPLGRIGRVGHRIHGDRRQRARGVGYEFVRVAVDDASRVAYAEVLPDQKGATAAGFLERAERLPPWA